MRHIILDTDFCSDCDDAVAIRLLANLHLRGEIVLEGIILDSVIASSAPALGALMRLCGIEDVPVGADRNEGAYDTESRYHKRLIARGTPFAANAQVRDGVSLYREILANAGEKISIAGVGFENVLADLLKSPPDAVSPLDGKALVKENVDALWLMAGRWDAADGWEFNVAHNGATAAAAAYVADHCPVPIIYSGWEIGHPVISCARLPKEHPLREVMEDYCGVRYDGSNNGRSSYDPMTALLACVGDVGKGGYSAVYGKAVIDPQSGKNRFIRDPEGKDCYVKKRFPDAYYASMIDELILCRA